jgi:hypothetical protein
MKDNDRKLGYVAYWLAESQRSLSSELLDTELNDQSDRKTKSNIDSVAQGVIIAISALCKYADDHSLNSPHIDMLKKMQGNKE